MCQKEADIFQRGGVSKAGFLLTGVCIPKKHSCIETAEPQSSGARLFSWEGPRSTLEKPSKIPRVFPSPVMDVHVVIMLRTHRRQHCQQFLACLIPKPECCILLWAWGCEPWGLCGKGHRLLAAAPAKGKIGWMCEWETGEWALKLHQSSVLDPGWWCNWPDLLGARWQNH